MQQLSDQFPSSANRLRIATRVEPSETVLTKNDLATLDEKFRDLGEKIKSGDYIVEAKQEGNEECLALTTPRLALYADSTLLTVTIKPSAQNSGAPIKEMTFTYQHDFTRGMGTRSDDRHGNIKASFRIETAEGNVLTYGPQKKSIIDFIAFTSNLLFDVRKLGLDKIKAEKDEVKLAAGQGIERDKATKKAAALNGLKL